MYTAQKINVPSKTRCKSRFGRAVSINHRTTRGSRRESPLPRTMHMRSKASIDSKGFARRPSQLNSEDMGSDHSTRHATYHHLEETEQVFFCCSNSEVRIQRTNPE